MEAVDVDRAGAPVKDETGTKADMPIIIIIIVVVVVVVVGEE